jgi:methionyl-tRNA synthetase
MTAQRIYVSSTIPYVNAAPHLGHALELVEADVLARHHRLCGDDVRFQTGTDDNALKNVLAAQSQGVGVEQLVARNAGAFAALRAQLELSTDDFISTSSDPRHRPGVQTLWQACAASGDLYRRRYQGRYCVGCEQFWAEPDLVAGRCPEHGTVAEPVSEENWFFRLSRYAGRLHDEISTGRLRIRPAPYRNEVLAFLRGGLNDFSVSRPAARARGWGITVPGDPGQVIYVWWDALANYLTALRYGSASDRYRHWWAGADRRIHVLGKGVLRFHAVYWPAILLSAGLPPPTDICVHGHLTIGGRKISKSAPAATATETAPADLAGRYGPDAVRWWLLREVPLAGDADFGPERLTGRADDELAGVIGNLVSRVLSLVRRYGDGAQRPVPVTGPPAAISMPCSGCWWPAAWPPAALLRRLCLA